MHLAVLTLTVLVTTLGFPQIMSAAEAPSELRVNLLEFPERTANSSVAPGLSWVFSPNEAGETQSAYKIIVLSSAAQAAAGNSDQWASGTNPSTAARYFRKTFTTTPGKTVSAAQLVLTADNSCGVHVNGSLGVNDNDWKVFRRREDHTAGDRRRQCGGGRGFKYRDAALTEILSSKTP